MKEWLTKPILRLKEKNYQFYRKHKTKCPCIVCKAMTKFIDMRFRIERIIICFYEVHWVNVEYRGSDYSDFREYEVICKKKVRVPDGKGCQWPKTHYKHIKAVYG